ncbi:MAG: hypothetical protein FWC03_11065 [Treponema sp.]|nr:hypothetical protein [Treponema sp.]
MFFLHKRKFSKLVDEKEAIKSFNEVKPELEKNDLKAMIIAALIVFIPVILVITAVMFLASWLLGG